MIFRTNRVDLLKDLTPHPLQGESLSFDTESQDEVQGEPLSIKWRGGDRGRGKNGYSFAFLANINLCINNSFGEDSNF
jgi:hypothetical protein